MHRSARQNAKLSGEGGRQITLVDAPQTDIAWNLTTPLKAICERHGYQIKAFLRPKNGSGRQRLQATPTDGPALILSPPVGAGHALVSLAMSAQRQERQWTLGIGLTL